MGIGGGRREKRNKANETQAFHPSIEEDSAEARQIREDKETAKKVAQEYQERLAQGDHMSFGGNLLKSDRMDLVLKYEPQSKLAETIRGMKELSAENKARKMLEKSDGTGSVVASNISAEQGGGDPSQTGEFDMDKIEEGIAAQEQEGAQSSATQQLASQKKGVWGTVKGWFGN